MITVLDVTHHYGSRRVLRDVSLHVRRGELMALMGPNGMGKSTLLGLMAGLLSPIRGTVEIDGVPRRRSPEEERAIRRKVVYLPADTWLPNLSGREWLFAVGRLYDVPVARLLDHVDRLIDLFDLGKQQEASPSSYSTGQKKKLALAAALVTEAPILLLDEPFSGGLDPSGILALKRVLRWRVEQDGATVVVATPVPELVTELADRVAVIRDGQVVACDTVPMLVATTGAAGGLDEAYEKLTSGRTAGSVERYFAAEAGRAGAAAEG